MTDKTPPTSAQEASGATPAPQPQPNELTRPPAAHFTNTWRCFGGERLTVWKSDATVRANGVQ